MVNPIIVPAMCIISTPHILYAWIWLKPKSYKNIAYNLGKDAVDLFALTASTIKIFQLAAFVLWYQSEGNAPEWSSIEPWRWLMFAVCLFFGQLLNISIYTAVGKKGVYYGVKLGHKIPWCTSFPFNVVAHPQYVGSILTYLAFVVLLWTDAHKLGFIILTTFVPMLYAFTGYVESNM